MGAFVFLSKIFVGSEVVYWLSLTLCTDGGLCFFLSTSSFGAEVVYWLGLTPCTNGNLCFLLTYSCGTEVVCWLGLMLCTNGGPLTFLLHPILALKLCTGWAPRCALVGAFARFLNISFRHWSCVLVGLDAVY